MIGKETDMSAEEALKAMDEGFAVMFAASKRKQYAFKKNGLIFLGSDNYLAPLTEADFMASFGGLAFEIVAEDEPVVDPLKDKEYYSWGKKM